MYKIGLWFMVHSMLETEFNTTTKITTFNKYKNKEGYTFEFIVSYFLLFCSSRSNKYIAQNKESFAHFP